jgi:hypothetical protein
MTTRPSFSSNKNSPVRVRPFVEADREFVLSLAPRLVTGASASRKRMSNW